MRSLRFVLKRRERMLRTKALVSWSYRARHRAPKGRPRNPPKCWVIENHWSRQDDASARNQGWMITRAHTEAPWFIWFQTKKGERAFQRGVDKNRRLHTRALRVVAILALGGRLP